MAKYYPDGTRFFLDDRSQEFTSETGFPTAAQSTTLVAVLPNYSNCESNLSVVATIQIDTLDLPQVLYNPVEYCLNETARPLSESISIPDTSVERHGAYVAFFKSHPGEDPRHPVVTAYSDITPNTSVAGTTEYWVVQYATGPGSECYNSTPKKIEVVVKSPVTVTSDIVSPTSCVGVPVSFTPTVLGGEYDIPDEISNYITINNSVATLSNAPAGIYEFTYTAPDGTDPQGCPAALTQIITHEVSATSNGGHVSAVSNQICNGSPVPEINVNGFSGDVLHWEYRKGNDAWQTISNSTTSIDQSDLPTLTQGTYQFRALVQSGDCAESYSDTTTLTVTSGTAPNAPNGGVQFACVGSQVTLNNPGSGTYKWYTSEYGGTASENNRSFTMTEAWEQRYVSRITTVSGVQCESQRALVEARPYFSAGKISSTGEVRCSGNTYNTIGSVSNAAPTTGTTGTITYQWFVSVDGGTPNAISSSNSATFNPTTYMNGKADGTYVFTRKASFSNSSTSCSALQSEGSYTIIKGNPDATIAAPETTVLCGNGSITLTLQTGFSLQNSYQWYKDGAALSGKTNSSLVVTQPGSYTVKVTHKASGCNATSTTPVNITQDETGPEVPESITTNITGCSLSNVPTAYTTISALESGFEVDITDDYTTDADLTLSHVDDTTSKTCPFVVERTYTITDECGNASSFVETITVENTTKPVITIVSQNNPDGACNPTSITAPTFTVTDVCANNVTPTVSTDGPTGTDCSKSQTWTATYTSVCGVEADQKS